MRTTMGKFLPTAMLVLLVVVTILAIVESRPQEDRLTSQADSELIKMITRLTSKQEKVSEGFSEEELNKMLNSVVKKQYHEGYCVEDASCGNIAYYPDLDLCRRPEWSTACPWSCHRCKTGQSPSLKRIDALGCGRRPLLDNGASYLNGRSRRIMGGDKAKPSSWPSICSLWIPAWSGPHFACGGTLVKNEQGVFYLISAAHCVDVISEGKHIVYTYDQFTARCGHDSQHGYEPHRQILTFSGVKLHPKYDSSGTRQPDIAIFTFKEQPKETKYVQAACIPNEDTEGQEGIVVGWGMTDHRDSNSASEVLLQLKNPILSDEECAKLNPGYAQDNMMCAMASGRGKSPCPGDSGGPLYTNIDGKWTLAGVVSHGITKDWGDPICGGLNTPEMYADVFQLRSWIDEIING